MKKQIKYFAASTLFMFSIGAKNVDTETEIPALSTSKRLGQTEKVDSRQQGPLHIFQLFNMTVALTTCLSDSNRVSAKINILYKPNLSNPGLEEKIETELRKAWRKTFKNLTVRDILTKPDNTPEDVYRMEFSTKNLHEATAAVAKKEKTQIIVTDLKPGVTESACRWL